MKSKFSKKNFKLIIKRVCEKNNIKEIAIINDLIDNNLLPETFISKVKKNYYKIDSMSMEKLFNYKQSRSENDYVTKRREIMLCNAINNGHSNIIVEKLDNEFLKYDLNLQMLKKKVE